MKKDVLKLKCLFSILIALFLLFFQYSNLQACNNELKDRSNIIMENLTFDDTTYEKVNVSNLPISKFLECKKNKISKISEREVNRTKTYIKKISDYEFLFIGGIDRYSYRGQESVGAKEEEINQIIKYDIIKNRFEKINDFQTSLNKSIIDLEDNSLLFIDKNNSIKRYYINTNKFESISENFQYIILSKYNENKLLCLLQNSLYAFDLVSKEIQLINKLNKKICGKIFNINNDILLVYNQPNSSSSYLYSIKNNKILQDIGIENINAIEKISEDLLLIIQTKEKRNDNNDDKKNNNYKDNIIVYDLKNKKIIKNFLYRENGKHYSFYGLKKLNNEKIIIYNKYSFLNIFCTNELITKKINKEFYFPSDPIEQLVDINDHQLLINTQRNIYVYTY